MILISFNFIEMLAEEIIALDFSNSTIRKGLEVYFYGLAASRGYLIDFGQLRNVLAKISTDDEENHRLLGEFIKGFSDGFP